MSIISIGELLIDFISQDIGNSLSTSNTFLKKAGGAPANVSAVISRLGGKASFCGKVGQDAFGKFLEDTLKSHGVDTEFLIKDQDRPTTLAFVSLEADGERDFSFVRGADASLTISDIDMYKILKNNIIHFGSATGFLPGELKETYKLLLEKACEKEIFISFDPNYRSAFWKGKEKEFIEHSLYFISKSDFVKVSDEELFILSGSKDIDEGAAILHQKGAKILAITLGNKGTYISNSTNGEIVESIKVEAIDSTGAGDAFVGAFLYHLEKNKMNINDFEVLKTCVYEANKIAASVCTKMGAMEALDVVGQSLK